MASSSDQLSDAIDSKSKVQLGYEALRISDGIRQHVKEHGEEIRRIAAGEDNRKKEIAFIREEMFQDENTITEPPNPEQYRERMRKCFKSGRKFEKLLREKKTAKAEETAANYDLIDGIIQVLGPQLLHERLEAFVARQRETSQPNAEMNRGIKRSIEDPPNRSYKSPRTEGEAPAKPPQESALIVVPE